jgi:Tfp pilus assembly protein PilO
MNKLFVTIGSIIGVVLIGWFLTYPAYLRYDSTVKEIEAKKIQFANREDYLKRLNEISSKLSQYQDKLAKIDSALPEETSLPDIYDYFLRIVSESGLTYEDLSVSGVDSPGESTNVQFEETIISPENSIFVTQGIREVQEAEITLNVSGSYESFKNLLEIINRSSRLFRIQSMEVELKGNNSIGSGIEGGPVVSSEEEFSFILELIVSSY